MGDARAVVATAVGAATATEAVATAGAAMVVAVGGGARATLAGASAGAAMAGGGGRREAGEDARSGNHIAIRCTQRQSSGPSQQKDVHALARQGTKRSQNQ